MTREEVGEKGGYVASSHIIDWWNIMKLKTVPITFKVTQYMNKIMNEMVLNEEYNNRAELIRVVIDKFLDWEFGYLTTAKRIKKR